MVVIVVAVLVGAFVSDAFAHAIDAHASERNWWRGLGAVVGLVFGLAAFGIGHGSSEKQRLIAQCLADGKKEYECAALFNDRVDPGVYIPIPIPIPLGRND